MNPSFLEQFIKHKDSKRAALICGGVSLTYAQLYKRCVALALKLRSLGVGADSTEPERYDIYHPETARHSPWVIIISERRADAVIGIIATFMAGGAYVLMGPEAPDSYIDGILEDTAATVILRAGEFDAAEEMEDYPYAFPKENEIACAIFTSGSTGRPKGAVLEHRVLNEMLRWQAEYMEPESWTATAAYAPFSFIAAIWEIFFPLANGLTLHILDENTRHDLFELEKYIESNHISYMFLPPNIAEIFTQTYTGDALKYLRVAGGRLKSCGDPGGRYEIMYHLGMAENGGSVTFYPIHKAMSGDIPIGKAWNKTQVRLVGETGEVAVSGPSLFRGYLSHREETLSKRVKNPYSDSNWPEYEMMYLSGDLARMNKNGELIHMGRGDWNIKIRDMKVDPMQVESALGACSGVEECCVTSQTSESECILIGWIVGNAGEKALRAELSTRVPEYMIPSVFVTLDKLPRNLNGKIDRGSLTWAAAENGTENRADMDGMDEIEVKIAGLFGQVLGSSVRFIGAEDSFLKLGGNSLKLMQLQVEIAREFSRNIPYSVLSSNPTPRMLAGLIKNRPEYESEHIPSAGPSDAYPVSAPMRQMWLLWRTGQDRGKYTVSIKCRYTGELVKTRLESALDELTRRNAILRSRFEERVGEVFQIVEDKADIQVGRRARREFDLTAAPLLDVSLDENILTFTTHHIIADAIGLRMLMEDFWTLYIGGKPQKSAQVHDATMWSLSNVNECDVKKYERSVHMQFTPSRSDGQFICSSTHLRSKKTGADESFWRQMFHDGVPTLDLPCDFARPASLISSGVESVLFDEDDTAWLNEYAASHMATLFQLFLTGFALLLSKLSGGGNVVVGVPFAGREHPDTARTIGMFVRTLPVRLDVSGMEFDEALRHTRERFSAVWEHQDMPLERLTRLIDVSRASSQGPFYNVMINYVPLPRPLRDDLGLHPQILRGEYPGALFDLVLDLREETSGVSAVFTYASELFMPERIRDWADAFKGLLMSHELELDVSSPIMTSGGDEYPAAQADESAVQAQALLQAWKDVLEREDITPSDDFLSIGGTSLAAIRVEAELFKKGWLLSAADIFQYPRLSDMAALMTLADEIDWEEAFA